jgi:hypothetical protein
MDIGVWGRVGRCMTLCSVVIRIACGVSPSSTSPMHVVHLQCFLGEHIYLDILLWYVLSCSSFIVLI